MQLGKEETGLAVQKSAWFLEGQLEESKTTQRVSIYSTPFTVGRAAKLSLVLKFNCVSKEHAEIVERNENLYVRDLGSMNGTYINGEQVIDEAQLKEGDFVQFASAIFHVGRNGNRKGPLTTQQAACDSELVAMQFDRLINQEAIVPYFQPVVVLNDARSITGYEVYGRSQLFGLQTPEEMFSVASQMDMEADLSRVLRKRGMEVAEQFSDDLNLFINTHPVELEDDELIKSLQQVRKSHPDRIVTLEVHEAAIASPGQISRLRNVLYDLDMKLAFDDFGAGQTRLLELSEASPNYLKFDKKLVQRIDLAPTTRQQLVVALVKLAAELGILSLATCIEREETHKTLCQMGFDLAQGHLYGSPATISKCIAAADQVDATGAK